MFILLGPVINTASENINTGSSNINTASPIPNDPSIQSLEATSIFDDAYDDRAEVGAEADLNNLVTTINVSYIPITRIHKGIDYDEMNLKSAFLYGTIEEEVYVMQLLVLRSTVPVIGFIRLKRFIWLIKLSSLVKQKYDGIFISQDKYVADILKKFDFSSVKTVSTIIETNKALLKDEESKDVDVYLYRSMIRSLMYLTASRPNIMFVVCACARFQVTPKVSHLHAVKMIFRYFKGQPKLGLWYPRDSPFDLEAFSDSDYTGASLDRKSTTGGCQFLGKRLISWQCKKQTIVANSTIEAEYVDVANCCGQMLWIQNQMLDYRAERWVVCDITRLYKFHREYGKPGGIKIKQYFDVDLTVKKLVMHRLGKLLRNFRMKLREKYILPNLNTPSKLNELPAKYSAIVKAEEWVEFVNYTTTDAYKIENKEIEADEEPPRGIMWLKGRVNKDGEFTDEKIRSVGDKLKEVDGKIKEGTLNLDDGTDAMTVVFGMEKGGYARGVGSGVTYKRYFHLPRSRQATNERIELLKTQLDNERRERQQKDMTETKGMLSQLMNQLAAQGVQLNLSSQLQVASDVTPMGAYEVDGTQSSVVVRDKDARIQKKSNGLVTSEKEPVKTVRPKKTPKSRRNGSQDSQSQGNVSPTQELPIVLDATCIPDVGNNGLETVKDGVGGFFAWPKNQVVLDEEVTPPTTIQKISDYYSASKLQSKRKNYVSHETMRRQARTGRVISL
ncbi:hypothetical protein Tco_1400890 [Tanacetum coccineum]